MPAAVKTCQDLLFLCLKQYTSGGIAKLTDNKRDHLFNHISLFAVKQQPFSLKLRKAIL